MGGGYYLINNVLWKLAIPSILFAAINFFPKKIVRGEALSITELLFETVGGCSLWFTCSLVVVELIVFALLLTRYKNIWLYFFCGVIVAIVGCMALNYNVSVLAHEDFPWFWKRALLATFYVIAGGLYWRYESNINQCLKWFVFLIFVSFFLLVEYMIPEKALCLTSMGQMNLLGAAISIVSSVLLIWICKKIPVIEWLKFIGKKSIVFYFFSGACPIMLCAILRKFMDVSNVIGLLIVFALSVTIAAVLSLLITRYLSFMLDLRKIKISNDR